MKSFVLSAEYSGDPSGKSTHFHDCHQIIYITEGCAEVEVAGHQYSADTGTLILVSRFEQHSITVKSPSYRRWILQISPELPEWTSGSNALFSVLINRPASFRHAVKTGENSYIFSDIFKRLLAEKTGDLEFGEEMSDMLFKSLLIALYRIYPELFSCEFGDGVDVVRRIQSRFETDFGAHYTLSNLAKEYGFSVHYLCHLFKKVTGYPVMEHLGSCRIAAAKRYLAKTQISIGEIVEICGFSNSSNFSRKFKETTGISPSGFRKKYRSTP